MRKVWPCAMCGEMTARFLFKDKRLGIPLCSRRCEYEYFDTLTHNVKEQKTILRYIDDKIETTKRCGKIMWLIAGFGLLIAAIGFWSAKPTIFMAGVFPLAFGALSTSHFESKRNKLMGLRKRIVI